MNTLIMTENTSLKGPGGWFLCSVSDQRLGEGKKGVPETRGFVAQAKPPDNSPLKTTDGCLCGPTVLPFSVFFL